MLHKLLIFLAIGQTLCKDWQPNWIAHDAVESFDETLDGNTLYHVYKPYLLVDSGCVPFAAVDAQGRLGHGLKVTTWSQYATSSGCRHKRGQVYTRSLVHEGHRGIMFAYYFPHNDVFTHQWLHCVLWLYSDFNPRVYAIVCSSPSNYSPQRLNFRFIDLTNNSAYFKGTRPRLEKGISDLKPSQKLGGVQPMVAWDNLTAAAKESLNKVNYGYRTTQQVPFNDANFRVFMASAYVRPVEVE